MAVPIQKYPATEQELATSSRLLHPINNFGFKLRLFNWNRRGEKKRHMGGSTIAKNHQCQVALEKMSNMTLSFNRWNISNIDKALLAALPGNYILCTMYCFGHCSRERNLSEARKPNRMDKSWKRIQHKVKLREIGLFGPSKPELEVF